MDDTEYRSNVGEGLPLLIDVPTAGRLIGVGRTRAWRMVQQGLMPGVVRIGRSVRVSRAHLERWVDEQAAGGGT